MSDEVHLTLFRKCQTRCSCLTPGGGLTTPTACRLRTSPRLSRPRAHPPPPHPSRACLVCPCVQEHKRGQAAVVGRGAAQAQTQAQTVKVSAFGLFALLVPTCVCVCVWQGECRSGDPAAEGQQSKAAKADRKAQAVASVVAFVALCWVGA